MPTVAEQGFPGFEMTQWYGLLAPGVDAAGQRRQARGGNAEGDEVAELRVERLNQDAARPSAARRREFAQFIASEQKRWKQVVERAKIKPE